MLWRKINSVRDGEREASCGRALWICYLPFPVAPQQGSFCLVSFKPTEQAESSSEAKERVILWSENGEVGARILETTLRLTKRQSAELLRGDPRQRRGRSSGGPGAGVLLTLQLAAPRSASLHTPRRHRLESRCRVQRFCACPSWGVTTAILQEEVWSEVRRARPLRAVPCEQVTLSAKERKKKVWLYFITQILFLFSGSC